MGEVTSHRRWVYNCCYTGRRGLKENFVIGVEQFIHTARQYKYYALEGGIRCPCVKCKCAHILKDEEVKVHLYKKKTHARLLDLDISRSRSAIG